MNTFNHIAQALQEAEIDLYEVAKEDPASVRVEKINPSSLEGQRIGNGQFGFVKECEFESSHKCPSQNLDL